MSHDLNSCSFIGRLGDAPIERSAGETVISNFTIAVGSKMGQRESTEWVRVVAFNKLAETCNEYLEKGQQVYVSGRLQSRKWVDKEGVERVSTEVVAGIMQMLSKGKSSEQRQQATGTAIADIDSDIPW